MAVLHVDLKLGFSADKTRTLLGQYSRGCVTNELVYSPKIDFDVKETRYFPLNNTNTFIFISDYFGAEPAFDVMLIKDDDSVTCLPKCNLLLIDCHDVKAVKITNVLDKIVRAHVVR